ncbi:hypothetical protein BH10CYA1_BH10CYA1_28840 [soil metagenome]
MSKQDHSLDGTINDPLKAATTAEDRAAFSADQWSAMRGDAKGIGASAVGSAAPGSDLEQKHLVVDALKRTGFGNIDRDLTEAEKERVLTSAIRGADNVKDLIDIKRLERTLDAEHSGYIDCFPNFHDLGKGVNDNDRDFDGKSGGATGHLSEGSGRVADGIVGDKIPTGDGAIFLPPVDTGDRPIGIVPANRFDPRNPGVPIDTWGPK